MAKNATMVSLKFKGSEFRFSERNFNIMDVLQTDFVFNNILIISSKFFFKNTPYSDGKPGAGFEKAGFRF